MIILGESKLRDLSVEFAVGVVKQCEKVKGHYSLVNQLERSATSIGANIHEANYAHGRRIFVFMWHDSSNVDCFNKYCKEGGGCMNKPKRITDLFLGMLYLVSTAAAYLPAISFGEPIHLAEWCCITGILGGVFFIFSTFRKLPEILHLDMTLALILIFIATVAIRLNLEGAFWFIHLFGPIFVLTRFFLFCDCRKIQRTGLVLTCLIIPLAYILFAFLLLKTAGECPFPASMILKWDKAWIPWAIIAGLCMLLLGIGYGFFYLNKFLFKKRNK